MWDASQGPAAAAAVPAPGTPTLRPPVAADRRLRRRASRTGVRRCSRGGPASPPTRGMSTGWSSVRPTTEEKALRMRQAAEMAPATPATTSATARPAGRLQGEGVRERPGCSGLWKPSPGAALPPPAAATTTTPATPTGHRACDAVARGPPGGLEDRQDRRGHPWMSGLRPKWPWDWYRSLVRKNGLNK